MDQYLVIGLGSMGKRRVRCLTALGIDKENIIGMDARRDRCEEARSKYGIAIVDDVDQIDFSKVKAVIVSLPPDRHLQGVRIAIEHGKPVFVEASVMLEDALAICEQNTKHVFIAPSCTFIYHPTIKKIKEIVQSGAYGKVTNFSYHSGQYLPDWHPWENVNDFYVSNRKTGGAREIVPYELTWITDIFGMPQAIKGYFRKTADIGCDIEDSYVCCIDYGNMVGSLLVDVVGRNAARNLIINMQNGQIQWRWDKRVLEVYDAKSAQWHYFEEEEQIHEQSYNANIGENMYIEELGAFLKGIEDPSAFGNTMEKDIQVLRLLNELEKSDGGFDR